MKKLFYLILIISLLPFHLKSQQVVISEYFNISGDAQGEWTELLVIEDFVDMRGWKFRDNSDADSWRPAVTFKNIDLWRNLRQGTIIVINHRFMGLNQDADPSDGYIEVSAADPNFFDIPSDFETLGALSINQQHDMVQLLDANGNNVHALGHSQQSGSSWTDFQAIVGPKLMHNGQLANGGSLRIFPGRDRNSYSIGFDQNRLYSVANNSFSKGTTNKRVASDPDNQSNYDFWQSLREPDWKIPVSSISHSVRYLGNDIEIYWGNLPSRQFSAFEGFMIVRIPMNEQSNYIEPEDGRYYPVGSRLGSGVVVGDIDYLTYLQNEEKFIDKDFVQNAECNKSYFYKIYYYKFNSDQQSRDGNQFSGRGRAYNPTPVTTQAILKPLPQKPVITSSNNKNEFCEEENAELISSITSNAENSLQWFLDGSPIPGATGSSYKPKKSGQYVVKVTNNFSKCENISEIFQVTILPKPQAKLYHITRQGRVPITKDTTFYVCKDADPNFDFPTLEMEGGNRLEWYFNNRLKNEEINRPRTVAVQKGFYYGLVKNGECADKTPTVTLEHIQYFFDISPNPLFLDADEKPTGEVTITNKSNVDIIITDPQKFKPVNPAFTIENLTFPLIIKKNQSVTIKVSYTRTQNGKDESYILAVLDCYQTFRVNLTGIKKAPGVAEVVAFPKDIDFGIVPDCSIDSLKKTVTIKSIGTVPVTISTPIHSNNISFSTVDLPKILDENESLEINFKVENSSEGTYDEIIEIPYESIETTPKKGTLKVNLKYQIVHPKLNYNYVNKINIPTCSDTAYYELELENPTPLSLTITKNFTNPKVQIDNPPIPLNINPKEKIKLRLIAISSTGDNFDDILTIAPCNRDTTIKFELNKTNVAIQLDNTKHDFGVIPFCDNGMYPIKFSTKIKVQGGSARLKETKNLNNFKLNLTSNEIISDLFTLEFEYIGKTPGAFEDNISLVFDPCDITANITLSGLSVRPSIEYDPSQINFTNVPISQEVSQAINIKNLSPFDLDFTFQNNKSEFKSSEYKLKINSGKTATIQILFASEKPSTTYVDTLYVYTEPCAEILAKIPLQAKTQSNFASGIVTLDLPLSVSGYVGDQITVPVKHINKNLNIQKSGITRLKYTISYNGRQVYPNNVAFKNSNWKNYIQSAVLKEESMNRATLELNITNTINNPSDLDYDLSFLMLQTTAIKNILKIDSVSVVAGGDVLFEIDSTTILTNENCRLNQRNIVFDTTGFVPKVELRDNKINIEFHTPVNGDVAISIYSLNGELIQNNKFSEIKYGTYYTQIDVSKLQAGVYFVEIQTPMGRFTQKIIIIR